MQIKILGISGGTRDGVNDAMVREALMGAKESGAEVEFIHLLDLDIKPCIGCVHCVTGKNNGVMVGGAGKCAIKNDDFEWLVGKIYESDGLVFSMPIFIKGLTCAFQCFAHRFGGPGYDVGLLEISNAIRKEKGITEYPGPDPRAFKKRFAVYISVGGSDWVKRAAADYSMFSLISKIEPLDNIVFSWGKSSVMDDSRLKRVHDAGRILVDAVTNPDKAKYVGDPGLCPNCHCRLMYFNEDAKTVSCLICDATGKINIKEDGSYEFSFPPEQYARMHDTKEGKLLHLHEIREIEGKIAGYRVTDEYKRRMQNYKKFLEPTRPPKKI